MDIFFKPFALAAAVFADDFLAGVPEAMFGVSLVREAEPSSPHRPRPMAVVGAVAVTTAVVASTSARASAAAQANANAAAQANQAAAQANQSAAQANQAAADAKAAAATAQQPPPGPPPVGSIVTTLPAGCSQTKLNNVDYLRCGSTYYKPAMAEGHGVRRVAALILPPCSGPRRLDTRQRPLRIGQVSCLRLRWRCPRGRPGASAGGAENPGLPDISCGHGDDGRSTREFRPRRIPLVRVSVHHRR